MTIPSLSEYQSASGWLEKANRLMSIFTQWVVNRSCFRAHWHLSLVRQCVVVAKSKMSLFVRDLPLKFCDISVLWLWNVFYLLVSHQYFAFIQSPTNTKHRQAETDCRNRDGCTTVEAWCDPQSVHALIHYSSLDHTNTMLLVSLDIGSPTQLRDTFLKDVKLHLHLCIIA